MQTEPKKTGKKYYPALDLTRFVAALFVIGLHIFPEGSTSAGIGLDESIPTLLGLSFMNAVLRVAVPVFFLISSFLLFKKVEEEPECKWNHIGRFCLRLLFLYLFYYVTGLPLAIKDIVGFASQGDAGGILRYVVITLWKGAPRGFWFLVSLALSLVIASACNTKKAMVALTAVAGVLYAYGCLNCAYFGIFKTRSDPFSQALYQAGEYLELSFSSLQALLFVAMGKIFATCGTFKIKGYAFILPIAFALMVGELFLTMQTGLFVYSDAFFTLPLFVFFLMNLLLGIEVQNERFTHVAKKLKKVGSFSYLFHIQFFCYMHWILDAMGNNVFREQFLYLAFPYFICVGLCFLLQSLFEYLCRYKALHFLRYSY